MWFCAASSLASYTTSSNYVIVPSSSVIVSLCVLCLPSVNACRLFGRYAMPHCGYSGLTWCLYLCLGVYDCSSCFRCAGSRCGLLEGILRFVLRFDRWAVRGGSGAATSGHSDRLLGVRGVRAGMENIYFSQLPKGRHVNGPLHLQAASW